MGEAAPTIYIHEVRVLEYNMVKCVLEFNVQRVDL